MDTSAKSRQAPVTDHGCEDTATWGLLTETPPAERPVTVLEGVLKRESAEHTAHEVRDQQRAWANDLGRMVHELDYLTWAARSPARTHDWVQATYGDDPETFAWLSEAATWSQSVKADLALHHHGKTGTEDAVSEILARCAPPVEQAPQSIPERQPDRQGEITADLVARIRRELDGRLNRIEADPPVWYDELAQHHPDPAARRAAAADVLVWRAVSGQDDVETPLGKAPTGKDTTVRYHQVAHAALHSTPQNHSDNRDAGHDALVSGLCDNWINLEQFRPIQHPAEEQTVQVSTEPDRDFVGWDR